jgi:hypothetical protein
MSKKDETTEIGRELRIVIIERGTHFELEF